MMLIQVNTHKSQETMGVGLSGAKLDHIAVLQDKITPNHLPVEVSATPDTGSLEITGNFLVDLSGEFLDGASSAQDKR